MSSEAYGLSLLQNAAVDDAEQPPHARAFASWILDKTPARRLLLDTLASEIQNNKGSTRLSAQVAVLGFAVNADQRFKGAFVEGVDWLKQRRYFQAGRPRGFELDGLGILGVAIGILSAPCLDSSVAWIKELVRNSLGELDSVEDWNSSLIAASAVLLGLPTNVQPAPELIISLHAKGISSAKLEDHEKAWHEAFRLDGWDGEMTRSAARLAAINFVAEVMPSVRLKSATVADLISLLERLDRSFRHWTWETKSRTPKSSIARWDVENEYHVQNILWTILAPIFPDLDDEEWLKSLGHHHPRGDFAIPSLKTIVEAKYMRSGTAFSKITQEIAADASTYLAPGSDYKHLVAVIWDDCARTEEHAELREGLLRIRGVEGAIIISRPSFMERSAKSRLD
ncbi:hypothetical protein ACLBXO_10000 [Methylobacterium sp. C33D]